MKVVLVNDQLNAGGAEKVIVNIANLLHKKGIEVSVVLFLKPSALDSLINPSIPVYYLKREGRFDIKAMKALKKIVADFDIIHVHSRYNLRYVMIAKLLTGITKPAIVFHEHVPVLKVDFFTRLLLKKVDAYVAVLKSMSNWAEVNLKIKASKIFYLPNIVNQPSNRIPQQNVGKKILMVGNFWKFKNQLFAVNLVNVLPADFTLDIYGMVNDKEYHKQLLNLISTYKLEQRVRLIQGVNNIYPIIGDYNLAIHTSTEETGPLVLLEYMHAQLPFLTYNTGDVMTNLQTQLPETIVDSFELEEWKKRIGDVMMNEDARSNIRAKMKEVLTQNYNEESYYEKLQLVYKKVLA